MQHPSPLRYPGGKAVLAPLLADIIQSNDLHDGVLVEPFAGGAGASLQLLFDEYVSDVVINDADPRIAAFWKAVINQTGELVDRVRSTPVTMKSWHDCRAVYTAAPSQIRQLDMAFAVFFLNRCNRSGILLDAGPIGGPSQNGKWKLDARYNVDALVERIYRVAEYRERITVTRLDARKLLRSQPSAFPRNIVYLDPPYYVKGQDLYLNSLTPPDHEELAEVLLDDPPFHWVLTYDNVPEIRGLYESACPRPFELSYSAHRRSVGREVLVIDPRLTVSDRLLMQHHRPGRLRFVNLAA